MDGKAVFLLSGDSKLVHGTEYTVTGENFTFGKNTVTFIDEDVVYNELLESATAAVTSYETFANADLSTQELIDAAKAAKEKIDLAGLKDADKEALQEKIIAADALVTAAQKDLDDATTAYTELLENAKTAVAGYTAFSEGELATQAQVNVALAAKDAIVLEGLTDADKAPLTEAIAAADALVEAAQQAIDDAAYEALLETVEAAVADFETISAGDLSTQAAIDAAMLVKDSINLDRVKEADVPAFQERIAAANTVVNQAQEHLNAQTEYEEIVAGVEVKVANYEELANGDLTTQELINAAATAKSVINLEVGLKEEDKVTFAERVTAADALVEAAQEDLNVSTVLGAVNNASSASALKTVLESNATDLGLDVTDYNKLAALTKLDVSKAVLADKPEAGFESMEDVKTAFDTAVIEEVVTVVKAAQVAQTDAPEAVQSVLEKYSMTLGLDLAAYNKLVEFESEDSKVSPKLGIATTLRSLDLTSLVADQTATDKLKVAFDIEVSKWTAVQEINNATEDTILSLLTSERLKTLGVIDTDVADFKLLSVDRQTTIAYKVLAGKAFADASVIQTAFEGFLSTELAGETETAVTAVNEATAETIRTVLEKNAGLLDLDLSTYNNLVASTKDLVAREVLAKKTVGGYVNEGAIKSAFSAAVTSSAVLAVNNATTAADMITAIDDHVEALTLNPVDVEGVPNASNYYVIYKQLASKEAVAEALIGKDFQNANAIQTAFENAVKAERTAEAVEAVNATTTLEGLQTVLETEIHAKGLDIDLAAYNMLTAAGKEAVVEFVQTRKPEAGYTEASAIKTNFVNAVSSQSENAGALATTAVNSAITRTQLTNALTAHKEVIGINFDVYSTLTSASKNAILDTMIAASYQDAPAIKVAYNGLVADKAVQEAANVETLKVVLENPTNATALDIDVTTVAEEGESAANYADLSAERKLAVITAVFDAREDDDFNAKTEFAEAVATQIDEVTAVNSLKALNDAATVEDLDTVLDHVEDLGLTFDAPNNAYKAAIAAALFEAKTNKALTLEQVQTIFKNTVALGEVNVASGQTEMETAFDNYATELGLETGEGSVYKAELSPEGRTAVANTVFTDRPAESGYASVGAVKEAFEAAVVAQNKVEAISAINGATTATGMRTAVNSKGTVLGLAIGEGSDYAAFSNTSKLRVAETLLAHGEFTGSQASGEEGTEGYVPAVSAQEDLQSAFKDAVALEKALLDVKAATTAADMKTALEANAEALDLNLGTEDDTETEENEAKGYNNLSDADKLTVAQAVVDGAPYVFASEVKDAFQGAVTLQTAIVGLNEALTTGTEVATALETVGVDLAEYNNLNDASKAYVNSALADEGPFANKEAIQTALDEAVALYGGITQTEVNNVAAGINNFTVAQDANTLVVPNIPQGYTVAVKTTTNDAVIRLDKTIVPTTTQQEVTLTLEVSKNGYKAEKAGVVVIVPMTSMAADDQAVTAKATDSSFLAATYATKADAETAIKALATNGTLASTTIAWDGLKATVTLNDATTMDFAFTAVTEVLNAISLDAATAKVDAATATVTDGKYVLTGAAVTWSLKADGTRVENDSVAPTATAVDQQIVLVASATVNGQTATKELTVTVPADEELAATAADQAMLDALTVTTILESQFNHFAIAKPNQAAIEGKVKGTVADGFKIEVGLSELNEYNSSNSGQGEAKWVGLLINTGLATVDGLIYNNSTLSDDDVNEAKSVGGADGSFTLWLKADDIKTDVKTVTLTTETGATKIFTIRLAEPATTTPQP